MANATRAALKADPNLVAVNLDVRNAFGTACRRILLKELCDRIDEGVLDLIPVLRNTLAMMCSGMSIAFRHTDGGAASVIAFLTGLFQGGPLCAPLCAIVMNALRLRYRQRLLDVLGQEAADKIIDFSFADDTNIIVTVEHLEATLKIITDAIAEGTAGCNMPKTVLYRPRRGDTDHYTLCEIADRLGIQTPDKISYADLPSDRQGITTCGASIGTLEYERRCLQERLEKAMGLVDKVLSVVKEAALSERRLPVERSRQAAVLVIRLCAQSRLTYFSRVHDPAVFEPLGHKLDSYVQKAICEILRIRPTDIGLVTAEGPAAEDLKRKILTILFALPCKMGGLGFTPLAGPNAHAARLASIAETANRVRMLVWRVACVPVPEGAANSNPLEQPLRPEVTTAARASIQHLQFIREQSALMAKSVPPAPMDKDDDDPTADFRQCIELVEAALDSTEAADTATSFRKLQEGLADGVYEALQNYLLCHGMPSLYHLLAFREQSCSIASAWMTATPSRQLGNLIPDALYVAAYHARVFGKPLPREKPGEAMKVNCASCATQPRKPIFAPFDEIHAITCGSAGHSTEHDKVKDAIANFLGPLLREVAAGSVKTEQPYATFTGLREIPDERRNIVRDRRYPDRAGNSMPKRAVKSDITIIARDDADSMAVHTMVIDVRCSTPPTYNAIKPALSPSSRKFAKSTPANHFPGLVEEKKVYEFTTSVEIERDAHITFMPFGISRNGRLGPQARQVIRYISSLLDRHNATGRSPFKNTANLITVISTALQAGVGAKITRAIQRHQACLPIMEQQRAQQQQQQQQLDQQRLAQPIQRTEQQQQHHRRDLLSPPTTLPTAAPPGVTLAAEAGNGLAPDARTAAAGATAVP